MTWVEAQPCGQTRWSELKEELMTSPAFCVHKWIRRSDNMGADVEHELEEPMYTYMWIMFFSAFSCSLSKVIERNSKVDPLAVDGLLSRIAESSMDEMTFRLRQAFYSIALEKYSRTLLAETGGISDYEEWLLERFITQLARLSINGSKVTNPARSESVADVSVKPQEGPISSLLLPYSDDGQESHKMKITLETFTNEPLVAHHRKLVTADDLRMMDSPASASESHASSLLYRLPLWQMLLATIFSALFMVLISMMLIMCVRGRKKKATFAKTLPLPFSLRDRGTHALPNTSNTPGSLLNRLGQLHATETIVRERKDGEVWMRPCTAHNAPGALPRV
ncbi:unnamed protein product [Cylicocyclus nassatus]|uniref:Uncharacterized protein n=1 Tax=Cylicocyclus nassatus TaxID=53992 RepID=A0AA36HBF0_CYLNA|nr:unnamed protein product [Cylicocyclus nassatus]